MGLHRTVEGRERRGKLAPRCCEQAPSSLGGGERPRSPERVRTSEERFEDRTCLVDLPQGDERLDLIGDEPQHSGFSESRIEHTLGEGSEEAVCLLHVPERNLEEAERRKIELARLYQPRLSAEFQPFLSCLPGDHRPAKVPLDERPRRERKRPIRLLAGEPRDGAALVGVATRLRPVAGPALELGQQEQDHRERTLVAGLSAALLEVAEGRSGCVELVDPQQHTGLAERGTSKRTEIHPRPLERDRAAHHAPGESLTGEEIVEADQGQAFRERGLITLRFREVHREPCVSPRAVAVPNRFRGSRELELDLGRKRRILFWLREGLFGKRQRRERIVAVVANPREEEQRLGPERATGCGFHRFFEQGRSLPHVRRFERILPGVHGPMDPSDGRLGRGELASELRQFGRGVRRPAAPCSSSGVLELRCHFLIRAFGGEREVTRPLLLVDHDCGDPAVDVPACPTRGSCVEDRREQREDRSEPSAAHVDHPGFERSVDLVLGRPTSDRPRNQRDRRLGRG